MLGTYSAIVSKLIVKSCFTELLFKIGPILSKPNYISYRGSTRLQHFHFRSSIVEPAHELGQEIIFMWLCSQTEVTSVQSGSRDTNPRHVYMYTLSSIVHCICAACCVVGMALKCSGARARHGPARGASVRVSADLDSSRFWIHYDVTHCLGMRRSLKCRKVTYKMCVAHPRKWIRVLLASTVLADLDGQNLRFRERRCHEIEYHPPISGHARSSPIR